VGSEDERDLVRRGYDAVSHRYRSDDAEDGRYAPWLADLHRRLPPSAAVLDLGCGCGVPVARYLANAGHHVTGVDISDVQIERARRLVPAGVFIRADATRLHLPAGSFDAVVCLYALIHMPLAEQPPLIQRIATWLRPGGWLLATVGHGAWTGTEDNWLGGPAPMWWSHADAATYRSWLEEADLVVSSEDLIPDGSSAHTLFWAHRS
jgi:SAM-dependent methyltransferase